ncbi:hypothetical protein GCM10022241_22250 [Micrococcus endophyticus]
MVAPVLVSGAPPAPGVPARDAVGMLCARLLDLSALVAEFGPAVKPGDLGGSPADGMRDAAGVAVRGDGGV